MNQMNIIVVADFFPYLFSTAVISWIYMLYNHTRVNLNKLEAASMFISN